MKLLEMRALILKLMICTLTLSCADSDDDELKGTFPIQIEEFLMPQSAPANQDIQIQVYAEAPNGCFKDLRVTLRQVGSQHYIFRATGYYESNPACPAVIVPIDTMITFKPTSAGKVYFQANEDPFPILRDTLTVF